MAISSILAERALEGVNELALPIMGASCLFLTLRARAVATDKALASRRRRPPSVLRRGISLLGLLMTVPSPAAVAGRRHPAASTGTALDVRMEPGRYPPPRLPGSAGPPGIEPGPDAFEHPWARRGRVHAVVHGGRVVVGPDRLFARWKAAPPVRAEAARDDDRPRQPQRQWHAVLPGDTLWSIAAERLGTDDIRRIARYWPRIHRANRDAIGPDPDLLRPGQVLELPPEHA